MTERYRYTGTTLYRNGGEDVVETGDIIEPTEAELDGFGDSLEPVQNGAAESEPGSTEASDTTPDAEVAAPPIDPGEFTIDDLENELAEAEYSDAELAALLDAEQAGQNRDGAVDAIQAALGA